MHRYRIVITSYRRRHLDPDNLWAKHYLDEVVRAGIIEDDSSQYVESVLKVVKKVATEKEEKTTLEIYVVD